MISILLKVAHKCWKCCSSS